MTRSRIMLGVVAVALIGLFWFLGEEEITNYPPQDGPIVAFGDSLIEGVGATTGNDLVSLLSRRIGEPIINLGISGNTTEMGFERIGEALEYTPRITLVLLGGNDYLRKVPIEETFYNLRGIIDALQDAGSVTVLLGVRGGLLSDRFDSYFEDLAQETGSVYVPDVLDGLIGDMRFMSDAIHPNDRGYARIAERVADALVPLIE